MQSINQTIQTIQSIDIFDQCVIPLSIPLRPWNLKDIFQNYHYSWSKEHLALNFAPNNPFPDIHSSTFQGAGVGNQKFHASHWPFAPVCFVLRSRLIPLISFIVTRSHLAFKTKVCDYPWCWILFLLKLPGGRSGKDAWGQTIREEAAIVPFCGISKKICDQKAETLTTFCTRPEVCKS